MTELINNTVNQHFISQAELRQNSTDVQKKSAKAKIFRYEILDKNKLILFKPSKPEIRNTSCHSDLFTLEFIDSENRLNLEKYFKYFEDRYTIEAEKFHAALNAKIDGIGVSTDIIDGSEFEEEIKFFRKIKFMNCIRNPHRIRESLAEFSFCLDFIVLGAGDDFHQILNAITIVNEKNKRQRDYVCKRYKVTQFEYLKWIKLILLFVYFDEKNRTPIVDGMIEEYFIAKEIQTTVIISYYTDESSLSPLVPDTGCIMHSNMTCFNVSRNCFVILQHMPIISEKVRKIAIEVFRQSEMEFDEETFNSFKKKPSRDKNISDKN